MVHFKLSRGFGLLCGLLLSPSLFAYTVLWDTSHGSYSTDYVPRTTGGYYRDLAGDLADGGFSLRTDLSLTAGDLALAEAVVISATTSKSGDYTASEVTALKNFVAGGGGLLVMAELGNTVAATLAGEFGFAFGDWIESSDPAGSLHVNTSDLAAHPLFDQVDRIHLYYAMETVAPASAQVIARAVNSAGASVAVAASMRYGSGRVLVFGDSSLWSVQSGAAYDHYFQADNQQFAMNTFAHLVDTTYVPEPATLLLMLGGAALLRRKT